MQKKLLPVLLLIQLLTAAVLSGNDYRTFSDTQGRTIKARITKVDGKQVHIRRKDGIATKADISLFSKSDQDYIKDWAKTHSIQNATLDLSFATEKTDLERFSERKIKGLLEQTWKEKVSIKVKNSGFAPVSGLKVEYIVFKFESDLAADKRGGGSVKRITGTSRIEHLQTREEGIVGPEPIPMRETKLKGNYYWTEGGERKSADKIEGYWAKVYIGDTLVAELCEPKDLAETQKWKP